jgi:hypothetical protein
MRLSCALLLVAAADADTLLLLIESQNTVSMHTRHSTSTNGKNRPTCFNLWEDCQPGNRQPKTWFTSSSCGMLMMACSFSSFLLGFGFSFDALDLVRLLVLLT